MKSVQMNTYLWINLKNLNVLVMSFPCVRSSALLLFSLATQTTSLSWRSNIKENYVVVSKSRSKLIAFVTCHMRILPIHRRHVISKRATVIVLFSVVFLMWLNAIKYWTKLETVDLTQFDIDY